MANLGMDTDVTTLTSLASTCIPNNTRGTRRSNVNPLGALVPLTRSIRTKYNALSTHPGYLHHRSQVALLRHYATINDPLCLGLLNILPT